MKIAAINRRFIIAAAVVSGGSFKVGDRVQLAPGVRPHAPNATGAGTVAVVDGNAIGIVFDIMPGKIHEWYSAEQLVPEQRLVAGYSNDKPRRFQIEAYDGGPLPVAGFDHPVIVDLSTLECPESMPLLIDHEATVEATLGSTDLIENNGQTLNIAGVVTATSPKALCVVEQADKGQRWQASIGVRIGTLQEVEAGQLIAVNGQQFRGPVLVARNSQMFETSVLPAGADWTTKVNLAARAALLKGTAIMPTFEEWLASLKIDAATLDESSRAAFMQTYDAMQNPKPTETPATTPVAAAPVPVAQPATPALTAAAVKEIQAKVQQELLDSLRQTQVAEGQRVSQIDALCVGHPEIRATAVGKGWTVLETENAVLRAQVKGKAPNNRRSGSSPLTPQILEAAVCVTRGIPGHEKRFDEKTLTAAHEQFPSGIGLQQMLLMAAAANGYDLGHNYKVTSGNIGAIMRHAMPSAGRDMHAAFSTISLPGILSNVANKELLAGYMEEDQAWKEISKIKSVSDFKQVTSYRMLSDMTYELVPPGGEIKHAKVSEESYTRQVKTYGKMLVLTREDIINDDLGAFDGLREEIGRGAAKKLNEIFWTAFINNSSFFTTARTNYIEGSTTNLALDGVGLGLAVKQFRKMTSPSGDGTKRVGAGLRPEILLVPPELEANAETLFKSTNLTAVKASDANIYANKYRPVVAWQLSDSGYTGYSTTAFYLLANPSAMPTMVVSFLNGQQNPTVESEDVEFSRLGIQIRAYHDVGCDQAEYLGGLKSKGAA